MVLCSRASRRVAGRDHPLGLTPKGHRSHLLWDLLRCTSTRLYIVYYPHGIVVTHPRSRRGVGSDEVRSKPPHGSYFKPCVPAKSFHRAFE